MNAAMEVFAAVAPPGGKKVLGAGRHAGARRAGYRSPPIPQATLCLTTGATPGGFLVGKAIDAARRTDLDKTSSPGQSRRIEDLMEPILSSLALGDAVVVKGSKGASGLASLVDQIKQRFAATPWGRDASRMLYFLGQLGESRSTPSPAHITSQNRRRRRRPHCSSRLFGPGMIAGCASGRVKEQPIREDDGPVGHLTHHRRRDASRWAG